MPTPISYDLLDAYLAGTCSPQERAVVETWLMTHPQWSDARRALVQWPAIEDRTEGWMARLRVESRAEIRPVVGERVFGQQAPLKSDGPKGQLPRQRIHKLHTRASTTGLMTGLAILAVALGGLWLRISRWGTHVPSAPEYAYQTAPRQYATIQLAHGVTVTLAPSTTVRGNADALRVDGEAYFDVTPSAKRPLFITTANAVVRVLGTKFAVRHYATDFDSRVVVEEGKVSVQHAKNFQGHESSHAVVLTKQMLVQVSDSTMTMTSDVVVRDYIGWVHGTLVFDEVRLDAVLAELTQVYGVALHVTDTALARQTMTLRVSAGSQSVTQVLDLLGRATGAHYERVEHGFRLVPGRHVSQDRDDVPQYSIPQPEKHYGR